MKRRVDSLLFNGAQIEFPASWDAAQAANIPVYEENGAVLGYAYAGRAFERAAYAWNAEISCYLAESARRRGIGRQLYAQIEGILRNMGVRKVFAVVTSANAPSVAFHHALGYRDTARFSDVGFKHGAWYDVLWLEKQLCPLGAPEAFPTPWI